jgi:hypothetical protein
MVQLHLYTFCPKGWLLLPLVVATVLFDFSFVSLTSRTCLYITCDLVSHLGPEQVLRNSFFSSINSWMTQGGMIPINYMSM